MYILQKVTGFAQRYRLFHKLRRFVYPCKCAVCGEIVDEQDNSLCEACRRELDKTATYPTVNVDGSFGVGVFELCENLPRRLVARMKHKKSEAISRVFAEYLGRAIANIPDSDSYFITYIPRTAAKKRLFGVDHCEEIIKTKILQKSVSGAGALLRRAGFYEAPVTYEQKHLSQRNRFKNAKLSFRLINSIKIPEKVIIIDDIITTGASAMACRDLLVSSGAKKVAFAFVQCDGGNIYKKPADRKNKLRAGRVFKK